MDFVEFLHGLLAFFAGLGLDELVAGVRLPFNELLADQVVDPFQGVGFLRLAHRDNGGLAALLLLLLLILPQEFGKRREAAAFGAVILLLAALLARLRGSRQIVINAADGVRIDGVIDLGFLVLPCRQICVVGLLQTFFVRRDDFRVAGLQGIQIIPRGQFRFGAGFFYFLRGFLRVLQGLLVGFLIGRVVLFLFADFFQLVVLLLQFFRGFLHLVLVAGLGRLKEFFRGVKLLGLRLIDLHIARGGAFRLRGGFDHDHMVVDAFQTGEGIVAPAAGGNESCARAAVPAEGLGNRALV